MKRISIHSINAFFPKSIQADRASEIEVENRKFNEVVKAWSNEENEEESNS